MKAEDLVPCETWIEALLAPHAIEVRERGLVLRRDFGDRPWMRRGSASEAALKRLFLFVFATVPDGCEIYLATLRSPAPVSALGTGMLALRWQVAGRENRGSGDGPIALRPVAGDATKHVDSRSARDLALAFSRADWDFELSRTADDRELWARVTFS
ncbi:MAG TPA: hypothetical protein ENI85_07120 [Deltaproteobacteria bacterium]|nr:hypothetical protein [Deltaproteobacteria bacterium]